jgi:hypothetical protein
MSYCQILRVSVLFERQNTRVGIPDAGGLLRGVMVAVA